MKEEVASASVYRSEGHVDDSGSSLRFKFLKVFSLLDR